MLASAAARNRTLYWMKEKDLAARDSPATLEYGNSELMVSILSPYGSSGNLHRTAIPNMMRGR